ncbi:hypothetical protein FO519_002108 [Halicephalobus sp. NKZ332]|nr:hypothetical protein FO519_002108 [Halicephalobus sp. NKZ332]
MVDLGSVLEVSYVDVLLIALLCYVIYRMFFKKEEPLPPPPKLPPAIKKQDLTTEELKKYNGVEDEHICIAVLGTIYDVTRGKTFYGPGSAYENLAGHDATRALANMDVKMVKDEYDDLSDLTAVDLDEAKGWADNFKFKYPVVGRLLKPGEKPNDYGDELAKL